MRCPKCVRYTVACVIIVQCVAYFIMVVKVKKFAEKVDNTFRSSEIYRLTVKALDMGRNRNISEDFQLNAIVMVYNRPSSLKRLLDSLNNAYYYGDKVRLEVWIDRSKNGTIDGETLETAKSFRFHHGSYEIFTQPCHAGIYGQWMGTWHPKENSSEIGVFLEDDITVSPYFFKWLKTVHKRYDFMERVNGYALQGVGMAHGIHSTRKYLDVDKKHKVYLYPILGTWGFSPKIRNWLQFLNWYQESVKNLIFQPIFEGIWPSEWYKMFLQSGKSDTMWEMWHIYHAWKNKEFTLYSNFPEHQGLTINWKEPGLHYSKNDDVTKPDPLLLDWKQEY